MTDIADANPLLPRSPSRHELAVLRSPDRRSPWVIVLVATMAEPVTAAAVVDGMQELERCVPMVGARLDGGRWIPGASADPVICVGDPLDDARLDARFDLAAEPPVRVLVGDGGRRVAVGGHHAAFDGLGLLAVLGGILGTAPPPPVLSPPPRPGAGGRLTALRRLLRPADRVAPSPDRPARDSYVTAPVVLPPRPVTARLAAAAVAAAGARNARRGAPWRRAGISIALGGAHGTGNVASYRRVDLPVGAPVLPAVVEAMASEEEPGELVAAGAAFVVARLVARRFSDSVLVSNLGRHKLPGVCSLAFFPVARGRSALALGAVTAGDTATLSLRARDIPPADAEELLADIVARLHGGIGG